MILVNVLLIRINSINVRNKEAVSFCIFIGIPFETVREENSILNNSGIILKTYLKCD